MNEKKINNIRHKFDIRVVATNGEETKKILWIKKTKKVICYGLDMPMDVGHFTYHNDGRIHHRSKQFINKISQQIPLADFKGRVYLGNIATSKELKLLPNVDFDYKKVDGLVYVDIRTLNSSRNIFNMDLQFVEAGKIELIRILLPPFCDSIHIFKFSNPWVVIQVG